MGIPYSKQIHAAFDEVTPLVAAGFEVLRTSRNISLVLAAVQVLSLVLSTLTLVLLAAILVSVNPDLEKERRALVTPTAQWLSHWAMDMAGTKWWLQVGVCTVVLGCGLGALAGWSVTRDITVTVVDKQHEGHEEPADGAQET